MHRRELLRLMGAAASLSFLPPGADPLDAARALHAGRRPGVPRLLDQDQTALVDTITTLVIPRTDTPGATDVGVTGFIDHLLAEWYPDTEREHFLEGLAAIDARAVGAGAAHFVELTEPERLALLTALDGARGEPGSPEWTFARLKSLTVYGYFTSERVMKDVTRTPIIPGRFEGCVHV